VPGTQRPYRINGRKYYPLPTAQGYEEKGIASWYGRQFHGRKTSNGETYNMYAQTAAHKTLPMNTRVLVKNLENNRELVVRINDRGPFVRGRIIDLSYTAAKKLDVVAKGTAKVKLTALGEAVTTRRNNKKIEKFLPHPDFQTGDFYIQIGSFTMLDNARRLRQKMRNQGKNCLIRQYDRGDAVFYRVQVQAGNTLKAARKLEKLFNNAGYSGAFVVAK
jgi:rare lipoprotein A